MLRVPEIPLSQAQRDLLAQKRMVPSELLSELWDAIVNMPATMRKLALMSLFQWYAMFAYWNYVIYSISLSIYQESNPVSEGFRRAVLTNGEMGGFYNGIAFVAAFLLVPFVRKYGAASMHSICLIAAGAGMLTIPHITEKVWLFVPAIGVGLGWASMMGNPYIILAESIPPERTGVYMGIFNMMIVTPMLINSVTMPLYFNSLLGGDARHVLSLAGVLMVVAAVCVLWTRRNGKSEAVHYQSS
jgi:maltose/moltooligosaccharide transporter